MVGLSRRDYLRWMLTLSGGIWLLFWGLGLRHGLGLFASPLASTLGLNIGSFSLAIAIQNLLWGLCSPICGAIADRYGAGRVALTGVILYAIGLWLMSHSIGGVFIGQMLIGVALAATTFGVVFGAVARVTAPQYQSLSIALVSTAGSVGAFVIVALEGYLLDKYTLAIACAWLALCALSMLFGAAALTEKHRKSTPPLPTLTALAKAIRNNGYILLTIGFFVCGFQVVFIALHLPNYFNEIGLTRANATNALALIGLGNIIGTLLASWLGARVMRKKNILSLIYLLRSLAIIAFLFSDKSVLSAMIFASVLGLLWLSTVPPTSGLVLYFFGAPNMAMLYGIVFVSHQVGSFFGAWLGGVIFRATGSYDAMWWLAVMMGLLAAALHYPIKEQTITAQAQAKTAPA